MRKTSKEKRHHIPGCGNAIVLALLIGLCLATPTHAQPNVLLIVVDTLRVDHLGAYGYGRPTSPHIDQVAREGTTYTNVLSSSSYTGQAIAALFTGLPPSRAGVTSFFAHPQMRTPLLAEQMQARGYWTGAAIGTRALRDKEWHRGFQRAVVTANSGASRTGPIITAAAHTLLTQASQPWFLYVHYYDPHPNYDPPPELYAKFGPVDPHPRRVYIAGGTKWPQPNTFGIEGLTPTSPDVLDMIVRYDAEIADTDRAIGTLLDGIDLDKTEVIITADHGEEFFEHGFFEHAWTLYPEVLRVPLIVRPAGGRSPTRAATAITTTDIHALVLGQPLRSHGTRLSELLIPSRSVIRRLTGRRWTYIAATRWLGPAERAHPSAAPRKMVWGPTVHEELYDHLADPGEQHNLIGVQAGRAKMPRQELAAYLASCRQVAGPAPSAEQLRTLRSLGYLQ